MYHEVGRFYAYTEEDFELLKFVIENAGYKLCHQPDGDISIMTDEKNLTINNDDDDKYDIF